ncbi:MAG TPA: hypothetical protein VJO72_08330 [Candidatus Dormibacteraeota bacterium]|nr:hypothetical protein [Candidatus Dormibacteraeota bacterium]
MSPLFKKSHAAAPALVTAVVEGQRDGTWKVTFTGSGSLPAGSKGHPDMDALVTAVDKQIVTLYLPHLAQDGMGIQYAWYPWGTPKPAKKGTPNAPTEFLVFVIETGLGYRATLAGEPGLYGVATSLKQLPDVIAAAVRARWPGLGDRPPPAMFTWERTLMPPASRPNTRSQTP